MSPELHVRKRLLVGPVTSLSTDGATTSGEGPISKNPLVRGGRKLSSQVTVPTAISAGPYGSAKQRATGGSSRPSACSEASEKLLSTPSRQGRAGEAFRLWSGQWPHSKIKHLMSCHIHTSRRQGSMYCALSARPRRPLHLFSTAPAQVGTLPGCWQSLQS